MNLDHQLYAIFRRHRLGTFMVERNVSDMGRAATIEASDPMMTASRDWSAVAKLIDLEWRSRKKNHPGITTPEIERLIAIAKRNGGLAAKVCGAGGGGWEGSAVVNEFTFDHAPAPAPLAALTRQK